MIAHLLPCVTLALAGTQVPGLRGGILSGAAKRRSRRITDEAAQRLKPALKSCSAEFIPSAANVFETPLVNKHQQIAW